MNITTLIPLSTIIFLFNLDGFIEKRENPKNLIDELIFQMA
jgi:hypothetical protein